MSVPRGGEPLFLAFDTSGPHIAACVFENDVPRATDFVDMKRGQAEAIVPMLDALLQRSGLTYADLTAIGVGVGPGNFTGVRISVSLARGLAFSTGVPAVSISNFDLLRDPSGPEAEPALLLSLPAPRDQVYVQIQRYGVPVSEAELIDPEHPPAHLQRVNLRLRGHAVRKIGKQLNAPFEEAEVIDIPNRLGKALSWKWSKGHDAKPPSPLYIRPPDAAPSSDPPPVILP